MAREEVPIAFFVRKGWPFYTVYDGLIGFIMSHLRKKVSIQKLNCCLFLDVYCDDEEVVRSSRSCLVSET